MSSLAEARGALRERLGPGARYDSPHAPALALGWARLGTAYFARKLNELSDRELDGASLIPGWTRRRVVAHVGYQARALTRLTEWAASGVEPMLYDPDQLARDVENGATLPSRALRNLFKHAEVHLNVEWRDLERTAWDAMLTYPDGNRRPARHTAWLRAREVWLRAVDLNNGGSFRDFPPDFLDALIAEAVGKWGGTRPFELRPTDREGAIPDSKTDGVTVAGSAAALARWLTGRGATGVTALGGGALPLPPRADSSDPHLDDGRAT